MGPFTAARRSHNNQVQGAGDGCLIGQAVRGEELINLLFYRGDRRWNKAVALNALDKGAHLVIDCLAGVLGINRQKRGGVRKEAEDGLGNVFIVIDAPDNPFRSLLDLFIGRLAGKCSL